MLTKRKRFLHLSLPQYLTLPIDEISVTKRICNFLSIKFPDFSRPCDCSILLESR